MNSDKWYSRLTICLDPIGSNWRLTVIRSVWLQSKQGGERLIALVGKSCPFSLPEQRDNAADHAA